MDESHSYFLSLTPSETNHAQKDESWVSSVLPARTETTGNHQGQTFTSRKSEFLLFPLRILTVIQNSAIFFPKSDYLFFFANYYFNIRLFSQNYYFFFLN